MLYMYIHKHGNGHRDGHIKYMDTDSDMGTWNGLGYGHGRRRGHGRGRGHGRKINMVTDIGHGHGRETHVYQKW
jgi:hypothetical protein